MRFTYPAQLRPDSTGELIVSFRDLPECLTSGASEAEALAEAADALEEAIAGRIDDAERIPVPSARRSGEHHVAVPAGTAAKAALALVLRESRLSRVTLAQRLGVDEKAVRRMLDPRHRTAVHRIEAALRMLGQELRHRDPRRLSDRVIAHPDPYGPTREWRVPAWRHGAKRRSTGKAGTIGRDTRLINGLYRIRKKSD